MSSQSYSNKQSLRSELLRRRSLLTREESQLVSQQICEQLTKWKIYHDSAVIAVYAAFRGEVDISCLVEEAWKQGKRVVYPKAYPKTKTMEFYEVQNFSELRKGAYGILEPIAHKEREVNPHQIYLALVPGVGFDFQGYRLGYGAGYYDRFFMEFPNIIRVGISAPEQFVQTVYPEAHDCKMDYICTSKQLLSP